MTMSNWCSVVSSVEVRVSIPALLTRMSSRPNAATVPSTSFRMSATLRDVGLDDLGLAAARLDRLERGVGRVRVLVVVDRDRGALAGELQRDRVADPLSLPVTMATLPSSVIASPS